MKKNTAGKLIYGDRAILILCIGIALIFWFLLRMGNTYDSDITIPVSYTLPSDWTYAMEAPTKLTVRIEGNGWKLLSNALSRKEKKLIFELGPRNEQVIPYNLIRNKTQNLFDNELRILNLSQDQLDITLDRKIKRKIPIKLNSRISFQEGYHRIGSVNLSPDSITLSGPASLVDSIPFWPTDTLILEELRTDQNFSIPLHDPSEHYLALSASETQVVFRVEEQTSKTIYLPVKITGIRDSVRIFPERVRAEFVVGLSQFDQILAEDFEVIADFSEVDPTENRTQGIRLEVSRQPENIRNLRINPASVEFFFVE